MANSLKVPIYQKNLPQKHSCINSFHLIPFTNFVKKKVMGLSDVTNAPQWCRHNLEINLCVIRFCAEDPKTSFETTTRGHVTERINTWKNILPWSAASHNKWHQLTWWRHQMESFPRYWPFVRGIHRSSVNSPHKGQWRTALMFLICAWINGWVNSGEAGDLRHHPAHYDVTVMSTASVLKLSNESIGHKGTCHGPVHQGPVCVCAQPMRDDVTM